MLLSRSFDHTKTPGESRIGIGFKALRNAPLCPVAKLERNHYQRFFTSRDEGLVHA